MLMLHLVSSITDFGGMKSVRFQSEETGSKQSSVGMAQCRSCAVIYKSMLTIRAGNLCSQSLASRSRISHKRLASRQNLHSSHRRSIRIRQKDKRRARSCSVLGSSSAHGSPSTARTVSPRSFVCYRSDALPQESHSRIIIRS